MQVRCISGYLGCSHSDSCCWNPVKLRLWHIPPSPPSPPPPHPHPCQHTLGTLSWSLQQLAEFAHQLDCILTRPLSPLFSYAAAPVSTPSLTRQYPWIQKSSPTSLPLSSACPHRLWPRPRAETWPARPTSCKATLSGCRLYRPSAVTISRFI